MGALHEGHLSLVRNARRETDIVIVSIFVNPTQFGPHEDYRIYPRTLEEDTVLLNREFTDLAFVPRVEDIYPQGYTTTVQPGPAGDTFEGKIRPGHFAGVLSVVVKLFNLVQPDLAVFGQKDAQQLFLIRRMTEDLDFPIRIVESETVREDDGLALSSRNRYLKVEERKKAVVLYRALCAGKRVIESGHRSLSDTQNAMLEAIAKVPEFSPDYATAVSDDTFTEEDPIAPPARLIIAGRLGSVRLIDNMKV